MELANIEVSQVLHDTMTDYSYLLRYLENMDREMEMLKQRFRHVENYHQRCLRQLNANGHNITSKDWAHTRPIPLKKLLKTLARARKQLNDAANIIQACPK